MHAVILSGSGLAEWLWDDVRAGLRARGIASTVVAYPRPAAGTRASSGVSLAHYVADVGSQIRDIDDIVLVAHSLGGAVAVELAFALGARLRGLVMVSAVIPLPGESFLRAVMTSMQARVVALLLRVVGTRPPDGVIAKSMCNDLSADVAARVSATFAPESLGLFVGACAGTLPHVPSLYLRTARDAQLSLALQDKMIARVPGCAVASLETGHLPMCGAPQVVADRIGDFIAGLAH